MLLPSTFNERKRCLPRDRYEHMKPSWQQTAVIGYEYLILTGQINEKLDLLINFLTNSAHRKK